MIKIFNIVEDKVIFTTNHLEEFIIYTNTIRLENEDFNISIDSLVDSIRYIQTYCNNLIIL